jgi:hypothetical protein
MIESRSTPNRANAFKCVHFASLPTLPFVIAAASYVIAREVGNLTPHEISRTHGMTRKRMQ